jgi:sugar phosphate isomerase/epimerase
LAARILPAIFNARSSPVSITRCFSTLGCPQLRLETVFAVAARHRIPAVELRALAGSTDLASYFEHEFAGPERLVALAGGFSTRIVALDASLRLVGGTTADRDQLVALAPWADALGVKWLRVFDGGRAADAAELAEAAATVAWWNGVRRQQSWRVGLMVETHDSLFTAAAIARFAAAAPDVPILWDSHHTWKKGGEDPVLTWSAVKRHIVHIHVKDSVSAAGGPHAYMYALPGAGEFPMAPLRAALAAEFAGPVSLEWEKLWHPELAPLEDALASAEATRWW